MPEAGNEGPEARLGDEGQPTCFGDPGRVCPKDDDGIIQPQPGCVSCVFLKSCLQQALRREGILFDSSGQKLVSKTTNFLKRWSQKKLAQEGPPDHSA